MINYKKKLALSIIVFLMFFVFHALFHLTCNYRVSRAGNIYQPGDRYYDMISHSVNLCRDEAKDMAKVLRD